MIINLVSLKILEYISFSLSLFEIKLPTSIHVQYTYLKNLIKVIVNNKNFERIEKN